MSRINQPINQVRLTNVAVIKYNYKGKRFEVACYKNKIIDYRAGLETDLSEVLQSDNIFVNVGKGEFAKTSDLVSVFGTKDKLVIAKIILEKGNSVHVSDLERTNILEQTQQKIAVWLSENCYNTETNIPYTVHQMKQALSNYTIQPHKPIKVQYLDAFKFIKYTKKYSIERCMMELLFRYPSNHNVTVQQFIQTKNQDHINSIQEVETTTTSSVRLPIQIIRKDGIETNDAVLVLHVDPSLYRDLLTLATEIQGRIEITVHTVGGGGGVSTTSNTSGVVTSAAINNVTEHAQDSKHNINGSRDDDEDSSYVHITESMGNVHINERNDINNDDKNNENMEVLAVPDNKEQNEDDEDDVDDAHSDSSSDVDERMLMMSKKQLKKARKAKNREIIKIKKTIEHDDNDNDNSDEDHESDGDDYNTGNKRNKNKSSSKKNNKKNNSKSQQSNNPPSQIPKQTSQQHVSMITSSSTTETIPTNTTSMGQTCNTCGGSYATPAAYRTHFRSDWHRFNQKLKLQGSHPISEEEFLACDAMSFFATDS